MNFNSNIHQSPVHLSNSVNYSINHNNGQLYHLDQKDTEINNSSYSFSQIHENDEAAIVILNEPSLAQWMGSIHPNGSLYEEPLDLSKAQDEHQQFRRLLEKEGCIVKTVRDILTSGTGDIAKRVLLEDFAFKCMKYELAAEQRLDELGLKDKELLSDEYKKSCIDSMSVEQLVEVILTRPTIKLRKSERDTELLATEYSFHPLVNLVFQRDQQITTAKGIVMASLSSPIRSPEVELMKLCFKLLDLPVLGEIPAPGKLEGGDFYPSGRGLCFIGVGLRSNFHAVDYLMRNDLLGTTRVAVVKDYFDLNQQRMHLDTVCNIINERVMLILEDICGEQSPIRRLVDEYTRDPHTGVYTLSRHDIEYSRYLRENGYELVFATDQNQKDYGCNGLNIGKGKFIVVDQATAKTIARALKSTVKLLYVDFRTVTKMYGSVHCCSQVVSRRTPQTFISPPLSVAHTPNLHGTQQLPNPEAAVHHVSQPYKYTSNIVPVQTANRVLMVAPTYFVNAKIGSDLINASVVRETRQRVLEEYALLHQHLRSQGVEVHLFCHEPYQKTPSAVFVGQWFSTHSAAELGAKHDTLVLYPLSTIEKQRQRRREIIEHGLSHYTRVIDLTACEQGQITARETTIADILATIPTLGENGYYYSGSTYPEIAPSTPTSPQQGGNSNNHTTNATSAAAAAATATANSLSKHLEFPNLVLDRVNKVAFVNLSGEKASNESVADLWAMSLDYKLVKVNVKTNTSLSQSVFIGHKFAVLCKEAFDVDEAQTIYDHLINSGKRVILVNASQMSKHCTMLSEVSNTDHTKTTLLMTEGSLSNLSDTQIEELESTVDKIININMSVFEENGGKGITYMLGGLF
ncbi:putative arginine deiminase [Cavenderia fasciculata]|uniref:Arginine deiminase n=1 Tax=Cavenderia fasciculata TaxID=261658 RepID=F4PU75_CACFS|nr:putative arginine deiminase [Cavenderia fasciculata]EGG21001.1 putative arginine deiminase [Cavenderia fasciculata]|eukprot:XP_004358851.1 putative arginine deiminase [Cavenderia fasciculata]